MLVEGQKVTESQEVGLATLHWSHSSWSHHIRIPWSNSFQKSEDIPTFSQSSCSATDGYNTCIGCGLYGPAWSSPCRENLQSLWLESAMTHLIFEFWLKNPGLLSCLPFPHDLLPWGISTATWHLSHSEAEKTTQASINPKLGSFNFGQNFLPFFSTKKNKKMTRK